MKKNFYTQEQECSTKKRIFENSPREKLMDRKEIKFYLKFHKGFRKNYTLNSALKSNLLPSNKDFATFRNLKILKILEMMFI